MFGYCGVTATVDLRARLARHDRLGGAAHQLGVAGEHVVVEVAHDRARSRAGRRRRAIS